MGTATEAFDAVRNALIAYARSVAADSSEREVKLTDLIKDSRLLELLLSLDDKRLQEVAVDAMHALAGEKPAVILTITFQNPGKYKVARPIPDQR